MRRLALCIVTVLLVSACDLDQPADRARPTTTVAASLAPSIDAPESMMVTTAIEATTAPSTTMMEPAATQPEGNPPPDSTATSGDGLGDSITVTERVTIVILDPEDE